MSKQSNISKQRHFNCHVISFLLYVYRVVRSKSKQ